MPKITFMGAGSTIFAKNNLGDTMLTPSLWDSHVALYDIDPTRLAESKLMLDTLNANSNQNRATITAHLGVANRRKALAGANYVINAIQVGGYKPSTVIDFKIPKKYGLEQTIGDTLGIGGIMRALRTIPVMLDFARDMQKVCPDAWMLNYTNPMAMITSAMIRGGGIKTVGLCHSVQGCAEWLLKNIGLFDGVKKLQWQIAGINHQAWLLELTDGGKKDLYPAVKKKAAQLLAEITRKGGGAAVVKASKAKHGDQWWNNDPTARVACDMVRLRLMLEFGYYITESSEHTSEYVPWFIKSRNPELIPQYGIPLDEYPRRCISQIAGWNKQRDEIVKNKSLKHELSHEFGSYIMNAMETDTPHRIHGNVMNDGLIMNLPANACVEVPCLVDRNGVQPCAVDDLPEICAAVNRTNINVQILTVEAALTGRRECIYQAAMMDPHTAAELTIDEIRDMVDDLIAAHGNMLPRYK